jgi:hypothetical protein
MAQAAVEQCIGRLLTDESARHRFGRDPEGTLNGIAQDARLSLTSAERAALRAMALERWHQMAEEIDPRLQRLASPTEDE